MSGCGEKNVFLTAQTHSQSLEKWPGFENTAMHEKCTVKAMSPMSRSGRHSQLPTSPSKRVSSRCQMPRLLACCGSRPSGAGNPEVGKPTSRL